MWQYLFEDISHNGFAVSVVIVSFILSFIALFLINKHGDSVRKKLILMYAHLFFLFFPLIFVSFMWSCQMPILGCIQKKIMWIVPLSIFATFTAGFFILPSFYRMIHKSKEITDKSLNSFIQRYAEIMHIKKAPKIYFIDTGKPTAHSFTNFKPSIYVSVGMFETLNKKELQAVILHELHHIMTRSSFLKFSTQFVRFISPIARFTIFSSELNEEEHNADHFAVMMQNTDKYLTSAKKKIQHYY